MSKVEVMCKGKNSLKQQDTLEEADSKGNAVSAGWHQIEGFINHYFAYTIVDFKVKQY